MLLFLDFSLRVVSPNQIHHFILYHEKSTLSHWFCYHHWHIACPGVSIKEAKSAQVYYTAPHIVLDHIMVTNCYDPSTVQGTATQAEKDCITNNILSGNYQCVTVKVIPLIDSHLI